MTKPLPDFTFEDAVSGIVCGVDEVGRGPWAGPIVAAAVILDRAVVPDGIRDSKTMTHLQRTRIANSLHQCAATGIGKVSVRELDRIGLTKANDLAMARAIAALPQIPTLALTDGKRSPLGLPCPAKPIIKGDGKSLSIAAASIVAKVYRDALMASLAKKHPGYGWETNSGYGTRAHAEALKTLGITPHHRRSFKPIAEAISQETVTDI